MLTARKPNKIKGFKNFQKGIAIKTQSAIIELCPRGHGKNEKDGKVKWLKTTV